MKFVFLTACRNEEAILPQFFSEFAATLEAAGIAERSVLYIVDDLSTDGTPNLLATEQKAGHPFRLEVIRAPTNFGNQGAMFYGLGQIEVEDEDVLFTFDCDGEDDVHQLASILALGEANPGRFVMIERGRRSESLRFRFFFAGYKVLFWFLTGQTVVPNNFMLIRGRYVPVIRRSPLCAVHFAYGILRLKPPYVKTTRDRRPRYGGQTSQNLFMLVSHGLVGLMVFYEVVIAKLFMLLFVFGLGSTLVIGLALVLPASDDQIQRTLIWTAIAGGIGAVGLFALLLSAALALIFKLGVFTLGRMSAPPADPPGRA